MNGFNDHLNKLAEAENVHVLYESGPYNGTLALLHHPGGTIDVSGEPGQADKHGTYGLSHKMPGGVLVYMFMGWDK